MLGGVQTDKVSVSEGVLRECLKKQGVSVKQMSGRVGDQKVFW